MIVSAGVWNKMVDWYFRHRVRAVLALGGSPWRHPWHTSVSWSEEHGRWEASVAPGLVNGMDVTCSVITPPDAVPVDVPLTDFPRLPLAEFRAITSLVPEFFVARGVRSASSLMVREEDAALPPRQLRACDLVLHIPRQRTVVRWDSPPSEVGAGARFTVGSAPPPRAGAFLRAAREFAPPAARDDRAALTGETADAGLDSALVGAVFFLSPPDAPPDAGVDAAWEPHVRHELFWNVTHTVTAPVSAGASTLALDLAGAGAASGAQLDVNRALARNNAAYNAALQFLRAREITGAITTPGHRVPIPYDRRARLDPLFPYKGRVRYAAL